MTRVRVDLNITLDGFATTTDQTPENPFGDDWPRLGRWVFERMARVLERKAGGGEGGA